MKRSNKVDVPLLKDVVVPGKKTPAVNELPSVLSEFQLNALRQQIETIIQERLQAVLNKATQEVVVDIKAHLDKVLPELVKKANKIPKTSKNH